MADHHFLPADESANVRSVGQCWTLSPEVGEGSYWIYAKKDLYDIKIHDFLFYEDCFLEFPMPECLSITQYESISGEELSPYRRLSAGCIKTFIGGYEPYKALIHKRIPIRSIGIEIMPAYYEDYMKKQADAETRKETNLDVVAGLTGELLGEIFAWKEDMWAEELKCLGFYMGKFIYIMDAYEDRKSDEKKAAFNPLIAMEQENEADFETLCKLILTSMMSECAKSFERLPVLLHADILRNVLYSGVWSRYEYIQKRKQKGRGSSDGKPKSV